MFKSLSPLAAAGVLLSLPFLAAPALALARVTYVSVTGSDSGTCASPAAPCRSFQFAFGQTSPGGEINALEPGGYGAVTITNSISIAGVEGAGINAPSGNQITINAGATDTVNLSYLTLDGRTTASTGISFNSGGSLTISHCTVRKFSNDGILIQAGLGRLDHVLAYNNAADGILVFQATVLAVDSTAANNGIGFAAEGGVAVLRLAHSAATRNGTGVLVESGGTGESAGDNFIRGNITTDVSGTLTNVGTL